MIKLGIVSVTDRSKTPREFVDMAARAGLSAIEWGSDKHVPQGDIKIAREVRDMTLSAGIEIPSYGSYYQLGSEGDFAPFVESALELGAKNIRVWAGTESASTISEENRARIIRDAQRVSTLAGDAGITLSTEYHNDSMTDTATAALAFLDAVNHPNFYTYWQQPLELKDEEQLPELKRVIASGRLKNIHIFQYRTDENGRRPVCLSEVRELWQSYFDALRADNTDRYAFIEFIGRYQNEEQLFNDVEVLKSL